MPNVDGVAPAVGDVLLLESSGTTSDVHNGLWDITSIGSAGTTWALERNGLSDETGEITPGLTVYIEEGTANGTFLYRCTNTGAIVLNTTPITLTNIGSTFALVTAASSGTVNLLGAANAVFQTDGATAGGEWRADLTLADAATLTFGTTNPATTGDVRVRNAFTMFGRDAANAGDAPIISLTAADDVQVGGNDADLDNIVLAVPAAGNIYNNVDGADVLIVSGTSVQCDQPVATAEISAGCPVWRQTCWWSVAYIRHDQQISISMLRQL
jgi:hypothetical protein